MVKLSAAGLAGKKLDCGVYYTEGSDVYLLDETEKHFKKILSPDSLALYVINRLNGLDDAIAALNTVSFTGESNVVIVKDSDYKLTERDKKLLENLSVSDGYLLFIGAKFLGAKEKKNFIAVDCEKLNKLDCRNYAEKFFLNGIDRDALFRLVEYTDCDMARINLEANKLADYCGERKVTLADVEEIVTEDADLQIYMFVNGLAEGSKAAAMKTLAKLKKRGEAPGYMLASLIGQYRRMLHSGLSKKSDAELADLLKVKEYAIKKARQTRIMSKKQLKDTLDMLVGYELKYKSGEISDQTAFDAAVGRLIGGEVK